MAHAISSSQPIVVDITWRTAWPGLVGPMAVGIAMGYTVGPIAMGVLAFTLPAIVAVTGLLTLPGFFVGMSLLGFAPDMPSMAKTAVGSMRDVGMVYLGLAPALLFMVASATDSHEAVVITTLAVFVGALAGLRAFYLRLREVVHSGWMPYAFLLWGGISLLLGWQIYLRTVFFSSSLVA